MPVSVVIQGDFIMSKNHEKWKCIRDPIRGPKKALKKAFHLPKT